MSVRIETDGPVWTVIHSRPEARNAMDPESAKALFEAFRAFEADDTASVAVFWGEGGAFCAGWDLKHAAALAGAEALDPFDFPDEGDPPQEAGMAAMGPSRLELGKPVIAALCGPSMVCPCARRSSRNGGAASLRSPEVLKALHGLPTARAGVEISAIYELIRPPI